MPDRPLPPDLPAWMKDKERRLLDLERRTLRLPPGADPLQTFEDGSPLGDTRFMNFGAGINAKLVGDDYVLVEGAGAGTRWGTVVVAASDTHQLGKDQADFVCTGAADQTTLDLALDAAPSGGEIVLLEGTYVISDNWTIDEDNIHIRGMGNATVLSGTDASGVTVVINAAADHVRLSQLRVVKTSGSGDIGIQVSADGFDDFRIDRVTVEGFSIGIRLRGFRWVVRDCYLLNNTTGIDGFTDIDSARGLIAGNVCVGGTNGIVVQNDCEYTAIVGNRCLTQSSQAIAVNSSFCSIVNNTVQSGGTSSIGNSIDATDCVFVGNVVTGSGAGAGMNLNGARSAAMGNQVNAPTGIGIDMAGDDSTCVGNTVRSAGTIGIRVLGHTRTVIADNNISLCGREGVLISTVASDCTVQGNNIYQCSQTTDNTFDAIRVTSSNRNDIQGNTIRQGAGVNDHRYGINIESGNDNLVCNNDLFDSAQTAAFNDAGTNTRACADGGLAGGGVTGAPASADYLVGTANAGLSAEIVVGTTPGGELGGTWASPTVDATHSGSAHADFIAKAFLDAKGDIISASADNTPVILTVGTNNFVLVADSTTASGLAWKNVTTLLGATSGWGSITNVTTDKVYDADATTVDELADVLGTLIANLVSQGVLAT